MAEKIRLKISPIVAASAGANSTLDEKLKALGVVDTMTPVDQVMLCFCLMKDPDSVVRESALRAFFALTEQTVLLFVSRPETHSAILDAIARVHYAVHEVASALLGHANLSLSARGFLRRFSSGIDDAAQLDGESGEDDATETVEQDVEEPVEENEEFRSKYQQAQGMAVSGKIKMALTGDQEWRAILVRDANKLVSLAVVKNPRITDGEILNIIKTGVQNDEIVRVICANKDWVKNHKIRKALVESPKTPLANALRYLATLSEKEIAGYAKSKNISSVVSAQAKRLVMNKKR